MSTVKEVKPTAKEKRAVKRRETVKRMEDVFGTGKGSNEPTLNPLDYTMSMVRALNYYNSAYENKDKRKWFMSYVGKNSTEFDSLGDFEFRSIGTLIRMKQRDQPLITSDLEHIESGIKMLRNKASGGKVVSLLKGTLKEKEVKPVISIQDRIAEAASTHIGEINGLIDEFITNDIELDVASYLKSNNVSPQVSKLIPIAFDSTIAELKETLEGKDPQLVEAYSFMKKAKLKKFIKSLESITDACAQQIVTAKAIRKPRARKEKPASVVANKVKFMKEFPELKLTSEKPEKIIGASEVWIYNTKYKKIQAYRSLGALGIKGTSILNYDVATSGSKTMRKPEQVTGFVGMPKRSLANEFKTIKTKESAVNGRINEDCIILKIFS